MPDMSSLVLGVVVPIPILEVLPSIVIIVIVEPPSLTLNVMSVSCVAFEIIAPPESTEIVRSLSTPTITPPSLATVTVPDVVSLAFDLK